MGQPRERADREGGVGGHLLPADALRGAVALLLSRLLVVAVAAIAALASEETLVCTTCGGVPHPFSGWPLPGLWDAALLPLAQFDAHHYMSIARDGYGDDNLGSLGPAFFPLYPLLVRIASGLAASPAAVLVAASTVSLVAFALALVVLRRLTALEFDDGVAGRAVLLMAFFPTSFFFGAPYTESLFLLLALGAFYAARTEHWAAAGLLGAAASATRVPGVALAIPLALLYLCGPRGGPNDAVERAGRRWYAPRYPVRADALWLGLIPLGLVAYGIHLEIVRGDALAWLQAQSGHPNRQLTFPLQTLWEGVHAGLSGAKRIATGSRVSDGVVNVLNVTFLAFALVAAVGVFRRLPAAYGAYVVAMLVPPLASPNPGAPLLSMPRFIAVLFPIVMWLALVCERRWAMRAGLGFSILLLIGLTARFATGHFVA